MYQNVPLQIPCEDEVEVRGEGMVAIADFEEYIRQNGEVFSHPRNMAAGSTRILDGNETAKRKLSFVAFELVYQLLIPRLRNTHSSKNRVST